MNGITHKVCYACNSYKSVDCFTPKLTASDGLLGKCKPCATEYARAYRERNPDKVAQAMARWSAKQPPGDRHERNKTYYADNSDKSKASAKSWREKNQDRAKASGAAWRQKNAARHAAMKIAYRQNNPVKVKAARAASHSANRDRDLAKAREWKRQHPSETLALAVKRTAAKLRAVPSWANLFFIAEAYDLARKRKQVCGGQWHVDHIVPLQSAVVCGLHCEANLQVIPGSLNLSKSNRYWPDMPA